MKNHTKPCPTCPFLAKNVDMMTDGRREEIADVLRNGGHFSCHLTVDYSKEDDDGHVAGRCTSKTLLCAGSVIATLTGGDYPGQMVRIASRVGMLDVDEIEREGRENPDVFKSLDDFIDGVHS